MFTTIFLFSNAKTVNASENKLILGGQSIGIKIETGVCVAGKYEVETKFGKQSPWLNSDIKVGDQIIKIDNHNIDDNASLIRYLNTCNDETVVLTVLRNNYVFDTNINVVVSKIGNHSLGLYIKDKVIGVGTLTFVDPNSMVFASLGHGIYDQSTGLGKVSGLITYSSVDSIKRASPGTPGEKRAMIVNNAIGVLENNDMTGIYGIVRTNSIKNKTLVDIGSQEDVKLGSASIYTVLDGNNVGKYDIEIIEVNYQSSKNIKGLKIKVTDPELINKTGGIVQGMSGSPIVQNGKIVGAISHVLVDNPKIGYGMHINWMVEESRIIS